MNRGRTTQNGSDAQPGHEIGSILNSERLFRSVYENANDAILLMDGETFIDCNRKTGEMFGCRCDTILQKTPYDFSPQRQPDGINSREKATELIGAAMEGRPQFFEWKHQRIDGTLFDTEVSLNRIDIDERTVILAIVRDVTPRKAIEEELKKAYMDLESRVEDRTHELKEANDFLQKEISRREQMQEALHKSEKQYRDFIEKLSSIVLEMDADGDITFMNKYGRDFFGFRKKEIIGKSVIGTIVAEQDSTGADLRLLIQDIVRNPERYFSSENENVRKNGERVWVAWTNRVVYNPELDRSEILCIGVDRTAQKQAQERLTEELQQKVAVDERNRLARDLHDAVSQTLFSASLIAEVLPRLWERDRDEGRRRLEEVRELSRGALAEMRTLLFELRPAALAEAELGDLLTHLADVVTGRGRLPVRISISGQLQLPPEIKVAFYRIAQEALNNVAKHSGATGATVELTYGAEIASLTVRDDGTGFDVGGVSAESLGIGIMKERAASISADLDLHSVKGKGTTVKITWKNTSGEVIS